ncbi:MAG: NADH-quinone oxidoreductase subunit I [Planctomycetota bacterium]|nr:NADH-quinone oxidoreductase subunit I [Planctomycetota bacterium]
MSSAFGQYFKSIWSNARSIFIGLGVTIRYFFRPHTVITLQYPREMDKLPERHRGIHFLETEKCIMCYICAKACPVDCIYIEGTRDGDIEGAYQGNKAVMTMFVIDYSLCIMCNLCCEPCPKDCIHMGQEFHFTGTERNEMYKNLLEDRRYTKDDDAWVKSKRPDIVRLAEEKKQKKLAVMEAKKKAAAEAKAKTQSAEASASEAKADPEPKPKESEAKEDKPAPPTPGGEGDKA